MYAAAHTLKSECRTEVDAQREQLYADWMERRWFGFDAIDPRTPDASADAEVLLERKRRRARKWLAQHAIAAAAAKATEARIAAEQLQRGRFRIISGGLR
jgi:hypothetical protein